MLSAAFLALFATLVSSIPVGPSSTLTISDIVVAPDGANRSAIAVNGEFPAPLIRANKNDNFDLNVVNQLNGPDALNGTSIHWHGIFQKRTTWADGAISVSQCPIARGQNFHYTFSGGGQAGTYWYHSHFETQYCDGLRGPLVIYDPDDPHKSLYQVDDESTVITLADWYQVPAVNLTIPATPRSTLINGKGRRPTDPDPNVHPSLAVINVQPSTKYRFRLVSLACDPNYLFSIDGHKLTVIEADGQNTKPVTVDQLQIFAGQRYSIIVETLDPGANPGNFWIRAIPQPSLFGQPTGNPFQNGANSAIFRYQSAPDMEPNSTAPANPILLKETDLHPLDTEDPNAPDDGNIISIALDFSFAQGQYILNQTQFQVDDSMPVLLQILNGVRPEDLMPIGRVFRVPRNRVVEVSIPMSNAGLAGGPHPFHLHGHAFSVVRSAGNDTINLDNPVRRDVTNAGGETGRSDNLTFRFRTDNPGPWFLHCHIEFHLATGLAVVFAEDVENIEAENPVPQSWRDLCTTWNPGNSSTLAQIEAPKAL